MSNQRRFGGGGRSAGSLVRFELLAWSACAAVVLAGLWGLSRPRAEARVGRVVESVLIDELHYLGNASCAGSECHSADEPTLQSGSWIGDELNLWSDWDPHARAYDALENDLSAEIAAALGIAEATASSRCLTCHAMDVPEPQQGDLFAITNAVGCESCHGPAEKWLDPHSREGWTALRREELGPEGLMDELGLVDTSHLAARANTCVACHLKIDKDMIDAGHPPLEFEMYAYSYYVTKQPDRRYAIHWDEPIDQMIDARLWATGQLAAREAATDQVRAWEEQGWETADAESLAALYAGGAEIVTRHFGAETARQMAEEAEVTPEAAAAAAADLAEWAARAADDLQRRVVAFGVTALGAAAFEGRGQEAPGEFWEAYGVATTGEEGEAYLDAVKQMAALAQE